jgi:hypothetical protein
MDEYIGAAISHGVEAEAASVLLGRNRTDLPLGVMRSVRIDRHRVVAIFIP